MDAVLKLAIFGCLMFRVHALDCYSCSDTDFNGETGYGKECFEIGGGSATTACSVIGSTAVYCQTHFTLQDGITTTVRRDCISPTADEDQTSTDMPTDDKCVTTLSANANPTDKTECYYHCNSTDNCNSESTSLLKSCSATCSRDKAQGYCNYIVGKCVCQPGYGGTNCQYIEPTTAPSLRQCVQCNSDINSNCASTNVADGTYCPAGQEYCSSAKTTIYDESNAVIRSVVTRGCTANFLAVDECAFTDIYSDDGITSSGYSEYTCYSTCDTDNCNKNIPNGLLDGSESRRLYCVQCTGVGSSCTGSTTRSACPAAASYCKATAVYTVANKADLSYAATPVYKLASLVRECAVTSVTTACTEETVGDLSFKKVSCQETCQEDGCNTGWPARPKCLQCSSGVADLADGYDTCLKNPPAATDCQFPYQGYCTIVETGMKSGNSDYVEGYTRRITRACSHYNIGNGCTESKPRETTIKTCNHTCTEDGCNVGSGGRRATSASASALLSLLGLFYRSLFVPA